MKKYFILILIFSIYIQSKSYTQQVWINEIHYDNSSTDVNEGVELAGIAGTDISGWQITLYNGNGGAVYDDLIVPDSTLIPDQENGFGTIWYPMSGIQNGPDGIALSDSSGNLIQFLSYEGVITATDGPASGISSTDIGVEEQTTNPVDLSLQLTGTGASYTDFVWTDDLVRTPDSANINQIFYIDSLPPVFDSGYPYISLIRDTGFDLNIRVNEPCKVYYILTSDTNLYPDIQTIKNTDTLYIDNPGTDTLFTFSGLLPDTYYTIFYIAEDNQTPPNIQDTLTSIDFTTLAVRSLQLLSPVGGETFYLKDSLNVTWTSDLVDSIKVFWFIAETGLWKLAVDTAIDAEINKTELFLNPDIIRDSIQILIADASDTLLSDASGYIYLRDTLLPVADSLVPAPGSAGLDARFPIAMFFNEPVTLTDSGFIYIKRYSDSSIFRKIATNSNEIFDSGNYISICPDTLLNSGETYFIDVPSNTIFDSYGNPFSGINGSDSWKFSIREAGLYISEYLEGSSYNKALEIFNPSARNIELTQYKLCKAVNGGGWSDTLYLTGDLQSGSVFAITNSRASEALLKKADTIHNVANFNGDDAIGLFFGDTLIDIIGAPDNDPGTGWSAAGVECATQDYTLLRKREILAGNVSWEESSGSDSENSEWIIYPVDLFGNLGEPTARPDTNCEVLSVSILSYSIDSLLEIYPDEDSIVVTVIQSAPVDSLIPLLTLTEDATCEPDFGTPVDFSDGSSEFLITAEDRVHTALWDVEVKFLDYALSENDILSFEVTGQLGNPLIDTENHLITATVDFESDLSALYASFTVSMGAISVPISGDTIDFSDTIYIIVQAENGDIEDWKVCIEKESPVELGISDIQFTDDTVGDSDLEGEYVKINGIVTVADSSGFYLQDADTAWSGIFIYWPNNVIPGDSVNVVGKVHEYIHLTELNPVYQLEGFGNNYLIPEAVNVSVQEAASEAYEGMLVRLSDVVCTEQDTAERNFIVEDSSGSIVVDNTYFSYNPVISNTYTVTGIASTRFGYRNILPRSAEDIFDLGSSIPSNDASLVNILIDGKPLEGFNSLILNYEVVLTAENDGLPLVSYVLSDTSAVAELISASNLSGNEKERTTSIRVTAEDGETQLTYNIVFILPNSINDASFANLIVYPNPVRDKFIIQSEEGIDHISVLSVTGNEVLKLRFNKQKSITVDVSGLINGLYIVKMNIGDRIQSLKVIKD